MKEIKKRNGKGTRCKVCNSGLREEVDRKLITGYSLPYIAEWLNDNIPKDMGVKFTKQNIYEHRKRHLDLESDVMRRVLEKRQQEREEYLGGMSELFYDYMTALEQYINKGSVKILTGKEKSIKDSDWLRAIEMYSKLVPPDGGEIIAQYAYKSRLQEAYMRATEEVVPKDMRSKVIDRWMEMTDGKKRKDHIGDDDPSRNSAKKGKKNVTNEPDMLDKVVSKLSKDESSEPSDN